MKHSRAARAGRAQRQMAFGFLGLLLLIIVAVVVVRGRSGAGEAIGRADTLNHDQVTRGLQLYNTRCATCHQGDLSGAPGWQRGQSSGLLLASPLRAGSPAASMSDAQLFEIIKQGGESITPAGAVNAMPGFASSMSDEEIWATLAYLKSAWLPDLPAQP